jgi:ribonuclease P protein component
MRRSLTKRERVRKRSDLKRLFSTSRRVEYDGLKLLYSRNDRSWNRVAFATVRGFPGAVARNRARRVCREAYRSLKDRFPTGYDLIFIVRPGPCTFEERAHQIQALMRRAGLQR